MAANFDGRRFKNLTPAEVKKVSWYANQSKDRYLIRRVFQGSLESTLRCEECGNTSPNNEKFLDISLPVWQSHEAAMNVGGWGNGVGGARKGKGSPDRLVAPNKRVQRKAKEKRGAASAASSAEGGDADVEENGAKVVSILFGLYTSIL